MKKSIAIITMLLVFLIARAQDQKRIVVDRNVTLSGPLYAITLEKDPKNLSVMKDGVKWYLENKNIGHKNFITFWITTPDGTESEYHSWHEHGVAIIVLREDGKTNYVVKDDTFSYVRIVEVDGKNAVHLHTLMLE
ncbi:MAG: hypothetical protein II822_10440 [Prevotella sp.]|nr:hypothetical protein [Prevotella sp.]